MRTIRIIANISLDGVVQAPGGPDEDRDSDFGHGGWAMPFFDAVMAEAIAAAQGKSFDLLLGRSTYDIFSDYWPKAESGPIADGLNAATKYVATRRPESLEWGPAEDLGADIAEGIRSIKTQQGPDLVVWGSTTLTPVLLGQGLADEVVLLIYPILLGAGKRVFRNGGGPRELTLVTTKTAPSGVIIGTYRNSGTLRTGTAADAAA